MPRSLRTEFGSYLSSFFPKTLLLIPCTCVSREKFKHLDVDFYPDIWSCSSLAGTWAHALEPGTLICEQVGACARWSPFGAVRRMICPLLRWARAVIGISVICLKTKEILTADRLAEVIYGRLMGVLCSVGLSPVGNKMLSVVCQFSLP